MYFSKPDSDLCPVALLISTYLYPRNTLTVAKIRRAVCEDTNLYTLKLLTNIKKFFYTENRKNLN